MAESAQVEAQANVDPDLKLIATSGPWANGAEKTTWNVYAVKDAPLVQPLANDPAVLEGIKASPSSWLFPSLNWYADPKNWKVELAQSGPSSWPRAAIGTAHPTARAVPKTTVSNTTVTNSSVSFDVSHVGTPVLVKISYFPNWHATGANGPWRVTPNLMVVVPTSHHVTLTYGTSTVNLLGDAATVVGVVALIGLVGWPKFRARARRTNEAEPA